MLKERGVYNIKKIILKEMVIKPSDEKSKLYNLRIVIWIVLGIILLASIMFGDNLFSELSSSVKWLLVSLILGTFFVKPKNINAESEIQIQLYEDYFVLYRPKRYYGKRMTRKEYNKVKYNEINSIEYRQQKNMFVIKANIDTLWYKYDKKGNVLEKPIQAKTIENGLLYFNTMFIDVDSLINELETFIPIKVKID